MRKIFILLLLLNFSYAQIINFINPKLKSLIYDVVKNSNFIQSEKLKTEAFKYDLESTKKAKGPKITLSSSFSLSKSYYTYAKDWFTSIPLGISLKLFYDVYDPNYNVNLKSSSLNLKENKINYLKNKINIEYTFLNLYLDYLKTFKTLEFEKRNLNITRQIYLLALEKYKNGLLSQEDLLNYLIFLKNKETEIVDLKNNLKTLNIKLKTYISYSKIPILNFPNPPGNLKVKPLNLDFEEIKLQLKQEKLNLERIKNNLKPTVTLNAQGGYQKDFKVDTEEFYSFSIGINLNWLLFDNFQTKYKMIKEKKLILSYLKQMEDINKNFYSNLKTSYQGYLSLREKYFSQKKISDLYKEIFDIRQEKFKEGQNSLDDLLDSQKNYLNSKENEINYFYETWKALFNYLKTANYDLISDINP